MYEPTVRNMHQMPGRDITYFFRDVMEEERRVAGGSTGTYNTALEGLSIHTLRDLVGDGKRRVIIGAPVYDNTTGRTKYEMVILKDDQDLPEDPNSYEIDMIPTQEKATIAERELLIKLSAYGIPGGITTEVKPFTGRGFVVSAVIVPDDNRDLRTIDQILARLLFEMGVNPSDLAPT